MSRKISQLAPCVIYLDENGSHVPWWYLGRDNSGNCRLLREAPPFTKRMHSANVASYDGCEMDLWLENEETGFLSRFDEATINALEPTTICYTDYTKSADGTVEYLEIARRSMLLSYKELGYGGSETDVSFLAAMEAITGKTGNNARIGYTTSGTAVYYWMRSASSSSQFRYVYANGNANSNNATYANSSPRPALSVSPDTIVSDEGADSIFLLPDGRRTYWLIDATCKLGESVKRPKKAKLLLSETDIQTASYKISNNAGDSVPVWTEIQNGGVATLANMQKETANWELAVKIEARSGVHNGNVGEPVLIVETEAN